MTEKVKEVVEDKEVKEVKATKASKATKKEKVEEVVVVEKRVLEADTEVIIESNTYGTVFFTLDNGKTVEFNRVGQKRRVKLVDLEQLMSVASYMLKAGIIYIEDEDVREYLYLTDRYENGHILRYGELEALLDLPLDELEKELDNLSKAMKNSLKYILSFDPLRLTGRQRQVLRNSDINVIELDEDELKERQKAYKR